jgi:hypothetical protein
MDWILLFNGLYDIICAISILCLSKFWVFHTLSTKLHVAMFKCKPQQLVRRLMAYWILTYGLVRLVAGIRGDGPTRLIGGATYFLEGLILEYELWTRQTLIPHKVHFVSGISFLLMYFCLFF